MSRRAACLTALLALAAVAACGQSQDVSEGSASRVAAAATEPPPVAGLPGGGTGLPGLPGDEALAPPPPDPDAGDVRSRLGRLPAGTLGGEVELTVSGLVGFAEPATGRCLTDATDPALEVDLSDGSVLRIVVTRTGLTTSLRAPGIEAEHRLGDVRMTAGPPTLIEGGLLNEGTTEPAGSLRLEFTCG